MSKWIPASCLALTTAVLLWSGIRPYDYPTWFLEVAPVLIAVPVLLATYKKFRLTDLLYVLIALHATILMIGGHYTYAQVPAFDALKEWLGAARNSYDGVGHFAQGFIPAIAARELLIRTSPLKPGKWMFAIIVLSCLGISAIYELLEWIVAIKAGEDANAFLGAQGDIWDTQKDMAIAGIGAIAAILLLSHVHDRQIARLQS